jgi:hypothetical protein
VVCGETSVTFTRKPQKLPDLSVLPLNDMQPERDHTENSEQVNGVSTHVKKANSHHPQQQQQHRDREPHDKLL